jgi:1-acyl-sn-glycerol-3-phosphate acyltransferase
MSKLVQTPASAGTDHSAKMVRSVEPAGVPSLDKESLPLPNRNLPAGAWWYRAFHRFITTIYFEGITLIHPERVPAAGPVLFLGLHRNGAVDGFVYNRVLRASAFLVSTQLKRSFFGRIFFNGIGIVRGKDKGNRSENPAALAQCSALLEAGGSLFIFPEGTSSLGPRHLPFHGAAAHLILNHVENQTSKLVVLPVGIHYLNPTAFRAKVEVVVGEAVDCSFHSGSSSLQKIQLLKKRIAQRLESVGINLESEEALQHAEAMARLAAQAKAGSYFRALKRSEAGIPNDLANSWRMLESRSGGTSACLDADPGASCFISLAHLILSPIAFTAVIINLPPFLLAAWAGQTFPDDRNVVSLWKILVGIPSFVLWTGTMFVASLLSHKLPAFAVYLGITALGIRLYAGARSSISRLRFQIKDRALWNDLKEFQRHVSRRLA